MGISICSFKEVFNYTTLEMPTPPTGTRFTTPLLSNPKEIHISLDVSAWSHGKLSQSTLPQDANLKLCLRQSVGTQGQMFSLPKVVANNPSSKTWVPQYSVLATIHPGLEISGFYKELGREKKKKKERWI